jgi:hypothetical protein
VHPATRKDVPENVTCCLFIIDNKERAESMEQVSTSPGFGIYPTGFTLTAISILHWLNTDEWLMVNISY